MTEAQNDNSLYQDIAEIIEAQNREIRAKMEADAKPKRSTMSRSEKTQYVAQHGQAAYLALPKE